MTKKESLIEDTFPVLNMGCAACAASVESVVKAQLGVVSAEVNYATAMLRVQYRGDVVNGQALQKAVQLAGYDLFIADSTQPEINLDTLEQQKYQRLLYKTVWALAFSVPVMCIGMFGMTMPLANWVMCLLTMPVVFVFGRDFFVNAWKQAMHQRANMDTLVALSTEVSFVFSVVNMFASKYWHQQGLHAHVYFESAAIVISFVLLGKLLEERAKNNTSFAIKKLISLQPNTVTVLRSNGQTQEVALEEVRNEDILLVKPGERIAVDGIIITGGSYVNESMLSGEPLPVWKSSNDKVFAGTLNQQNGFQMRAMQIGKNTVLAQIIRLVQAAQGSKASIQRQVDAVAAIFVPVVLGIAAISFVIWLLLGGDKGFSHGLLAMVTVLVIACPCALGLATPMAVMVGIGRGALQGILIKDAESLELASKINALVLDKTGTLTEGKPVVTDEYWQEESEELKQILCSIERASDHPLAAAIVQHFQKFTSKNISQITNFAGKGIQAQIDDEVFLIGSVAWLSEQGLPPNGTMQVWLEQRYSEAKTVVGFANASGVIALLGITDTLKPNAPEVIAALQAQGIAVYMLTGDNNTTAQAIAAQAGIKHYIAETLPAQKADFVQSLQSEGRVVAMVGDGINDSAALAQADVSIAMGRGSDIAIDAAKMTIISDDLAKILGAMYLSRTTSAILRQNLFWAFVYNLLGIPLAAGILYPINGWLLNPMIASAAMALSSVSVVLNSLRIYANMKG